VKKTSPVRVKGAKLNEHVNGNEGVIWGGVVEFGDALQVLSLSINYRKL